MLWTQQKQKILKKGGKNTQINCTKKDLHDPDSHDGKWTMELIYSVEFKIYHCS